MNFIAKLVGSMVLVIGLLLVTLYVMKALMKHKKFSIAGHIQIENTLSVGPKERIVLLKCGTEQILIGVTSTNIRTLHVLDADARDKSYEAANEKELHAEVAEALAV